MTLKLFGHTYRNVENTQVFTGIWSMDIHLMKLKAKIQNKNVLNKYCSIATKQHNKLLTKTALTINKSHKLHDKQVCLDIVINIVPA